MAHGNYWHGCPSIFIGKQKELGVPGSDWLTMLIKLNTEIQNEEEKWGGQPVAVIITLS